MHFSNWPLTAFLKEQTVDNSNICAPHFVDVEITINELLGCLELIHKLEYSALYPDCSLIRHIEPESHLESFVSDLLPFLTFSGVYIVESFSYKDEPLANLITHRLSSATGIKPIHIESEFGVEERLTLNKGGNMIYTSENISDPKILLCRHAVEHSSDALGLLSAIARKMKSGDYLVVEIPDSSKLLQHRQWALLWECHRIYLTYYSACRLFRICGLDIVHSKRYQCPNEDVLCFMLRASPRIQEQKISSDNNALHEAEIDQCTSFIKSYTMYIDKSQIRLQEFSKCDVVALLGGGHIGLTHIYLTGLNHTIDFIIDDDPNKMGMFSPCGNLRILSSSECVKAYNDEKIGILSSLSDEVTNRIISRLCACGLDIPHSVLIF